MIRLEVRKFLIISYFITVQICVWWVFFSAFDGLFYPLDPDPGTQIVADKRIRILNMHLFVFNRFHNFLQFLIYLQSNFCVGWHLDFLKENLSFIQDVFTKFTIMNERNSLIFVQNCRKIQSIFDLIFAKFSVNFRSLKIEIFQFHTKKIVFFSKK